MVKFEVTGMIREIRQKDRQGGGGKYAMVNIDYMGGTCAVMYPDGCKQIPGQVVKVEGTMSNGKYGWNFNAVNSTPQK